ncbi:DUF4304 domain-containing protein [Hymenobacter cellulosilyticus]|uniref:DUF4304 domain-containing protein n=1 Tax=Hymenobacter cellulosilyticus TaxID=2932248 RepID=A0A8T9QHK9_9BACT|nr:DUF4304 domain-containing protein [Hymenobacter cellulosilyticus]UOQ75089.1 DUF4304 domain-containing protein [Hymenobacter cellulosilyticus]
MDNSLNTKRDLVKLLDSLLAPHGFERRKDDWYRDNGACVSVIGLAKSLYGGQFSISLAFLLKDVEPGLLPFPAFHLCHFRKALQFVVPNPQELKVALDLESPMGSIQRIQLITQAVTEVAVPTILQFNSERGIAQQIATNEDFEPYCELSLKLALERGGYLTREDLKLDL